MPLVPIKIGNLSALIEKPAKPGCQHPWCKASDVATCAHPKKLGSTEPCGRKLCVDHAVHTSIGIVCQAHARMLAKDWQLAGKAGA